MRIIIDMQGAQSTGSRHRGIGRYSLSLAQAISRNRGSDDIHIILSGLFPETIPLLRQIFIESIPLENIHIWEAPCPVAEIDQNNRARRLNAEAIYEFFLASLQPDMVLVTSLLEGLSDDAVTSVRQFTNLPTAVIIYDLIPLIHKDIYLSNPQIDTWYRGKLANLKRANLLLSISESSRQEAIDWLDSTPTNVCNISTAGEPQFQPIELSEQRRKELNQRYGLTRSFIMYTGGIDYRKNVEGMIRAYARLNHALRAAHQLAIICAIQDPERQRLSNLAQELGLAPDELVLTGYVPENDLISLYNACLLFVFPSWHEGFGLPALEAMRCGKAVIASNASSLPEVVGLQEALFDPHDELAIRDKITQVLLDDEFRIKLEKHGLAQSKKFDWDISAQQALIAMHAWHERNKSLAAPAPYKPKLAYISPLPPERSGISDYSAELLPELARWYDIDVIVEQIEVSDPWIKANCLIRNTAWFKDHSARYERILYHFGNSDFHQHMFELLEQYPGVVVLHDFFLSGIVAHFELSGQQPNFWSQALLHSHGYAALIQRQKAKDMTDCVMQYPTNLSVLQNALGVIVHSEYSRHLANDWYGSGASATWQQIPLLRTPAALNERTQARIVLGLDDNDILICSFGFITPTKLNHRLVDAYIKSSLKNHPHVRLVFVGENDQGDYGQTISNTLQTNQLDERLQISGWAEQSLYRTYLAAADIGVQLRTLSRGETSAAVLDCMNYGIATIVNANGSMADLDREGVWMLPDDFEDQQLIQALEQLVHDPSARRTLGTKARSIIETKHTPETCAAQYASAIEQIYISPAYEQEKLIRQLRSIPQDQQTQLQLATCIAQTFPPHPRLRQLCIDVTEWPSTQEFASPENQHDINTLFQWITSPPQGWIVIPVIRTPDNLALVHAHQFMCMWLNIKPIWPNDPSVLTWHGDILITFNTFQSVASADVNPPLDKSQIRATFYNIVSGQLPESPSALLQTCSLTP